METSIDILKEKLLVTTGITQKKVSVNDISSFQTRYDLIIPDDFIDYYKCINGSEGRYDENLFCFYSFDKFKPIHEELASWTGIPDYSNIINSLPKHESCFVFADTTFHLFTFAVRLYKDNCVVNEIYSICGDEFNVVANSFSEFVEIYLEDPSKVQF